MGHIVGPPDNPERGSTMNQTKCRWAAIATSLVIVGSGSPALDAQTESSLRATVLRLADHYALGQFDRVTSTLETFERRDWPELVDAVREGLSDWPVVAGSAFALELAARVGDAPSMASTERGSGAVLNDTAAVVLVGPIVREVCKRLERASAPVTFLVDWHLAASALLQGAGIEWPEPDGREAACTERAARRYASPDLAFDEAVHRAMVVYRQAASGRDPSRPQPSPFEPSIAICSIADNSLVA